MQITSENMRQSIDGACQILTQQLEHIKNDIESVNLNVQAGNLTLLELETINGLLNAVDDMNGAISINVHTCLNFSKPNSD